MNQKRKKFSIIVPIYNCEKHLNECITSVLNQKNKNFELILVNDGSKDNSLNICKNFKEKYRNIIIKNQKNQGVSVARNNGIKIATGEYIMFLDADDYLSDENSILTLEKKLQKNKPDVLLYKMNYFYERNKSFIELPNYNINKKNIIDELLRQNKLSISPCDKVVRRDFLINNNIYFDDKIKNLEDADWSLKIYNLTRKIDYINQTFYTYRQHNNTASTTYSKQLIDNYKFFFEKWEKFDGYEFITKNQVLNYLSYQYIIFLAILKKSSYYRIEKNWVKSHEGLLKYGTCSKVKLIKKVKSIIGINLTASILSYYLIARRMGKIRL